MAKSFKDCYLTVFLVSLSFACSGKNLQKHQPATSHVVDSDTTKIDTQDAGSATSPVPVCGTNLQLSSPTQTDTGRPSDCGEGLGSIYLTMVCPVVKSQTSPDGQDLCCGLYKADGKKLNDQISNPDFILQYSDGSRLSSASAPLDTANKCNYSVKLPPDRSVKDVANITLKGSISGKDVSLYAIPSLGDFLLKTSAPMTLYVRADGQDIGLCDEPFKPCATIAKALSVIPSKITDPVRILIGGPSINVAPSEIPNYVVEEVNGKSTGSLSIEGMNYDFSAKASVDMYFTDADLYALRLTGLTGSGQVALRDLSFKKANNTGAGIALIVASYGRFAVERISIDGWETGLSLDRVDTALTQFSVTNSKNGIVVQNHSSVSISGNNSLLGCGTTSCAGIGLLVKASSASFMEGSQSRITKYRVGIKMQDTSTIDQDGSLDVSQNTKVGLLLRSSSNFSSRRYALTKFSENNTSLGDVNMELDKDGVGEIFLENSRMTFYGNSRYASDGTKISGMIIKPARVVAPNEYWVKSDITLSSSTINAQACLECFGVLTNMTPGDGDFYIYNGPGSLTLRRVKVLRDIARANDPVGVGKIVSIARANPVGDNYFIVDSSGRWCRVPEWDKLYIPNAYIGITSPGFGKLRDNINSFHPALETDLLLEYEYDCLDPVINGTVMLP